MEFTAVETTTTTASDLFSTKVLSENLYNDINNVCLQDPKYKGQYITPLLFSLFGYFANNKVYLKTGNWDAITSKAGMLIVGSSQDGKTVATNLVLDPLRNTDNNNENANKLIRQFEEACRTYVRSNDYLSWEESKQLELKAKFALRHNENYIQGNEYGIPYLEFGERQQKLPTYIYSDFNLQTLATAFDKNPNNTVLCQTDEFGTMVDMFNNGLNPTDRYEYILGVIDGQKKTVRRKTQDPIISDGSATVITCTTHQKFDAIKKTLFAGGLGNRLFYVITPVNEQQLRVASNGINNNSIAEFKAKIEEKTQLLINSLQNCEDRLINISTQADLSLYNELSAALWNEYNTEEFRTLVGSDTCNGMFGRFHLNLQQCILNLFLLNKFWDNTNIQEPEYFTITATDIKRGAEAYRYFLGTMLSIHTAKTTAKATTKQQELINLFAVGETVIKKEFFARVIDSDIMQDKAIRNFIETPVFADSFESIKSMGLQSYRRVK